MQGADRYVFMLFLLSFGFTSATSHYTSHNFIHLGFKATHELLRGEVSQYPISTKIKSKQGPHPTSIRSDGVHYSLMLKRATVGLDLSQEPLLDNAAVARKAKCDTANHCLNKQQNSSA